MEKFLTKLKQQAEDNPILALGVGAAVLTAASKLIDSSGAAMGRRAYAKQVDYRIKNHK